ncbi:MAG: DeoR/GlpR family DNA-binding transcription regulator [Planctomycetota bacterium]|nr:DeoR/GlpR family DNA-binding transcription regulator [Planctomycetota bacterium]
MLVEDRRRRLLETVRREGSLTVAAAEETLKVSRMTIHRDLDALAAQGLVRKVHGGAVAVAPENGEAALWGRPFEERRGAAALAKRSIGKHLYALVSGARTLVCDASSTVFELGKLLSQRADAADLFVVTGGMPLFGELYHHPSGIRVALHGGEPHPRTGSLIGPLALASLAEMRFDWAVVSTASLMREEGVAYDSTPEEAELKRAYMQHARKKVLALDGTKFDLSAPFKLADLDEFDALVTEDGVKELGAATPAKRSRA